MNRKSLLYVDQYGQTYQASTVKELCSKVGRSKARKMFVDTTGGECKHIGYVIGNQWLRAFEPVTF